MGRWFVQPIASKLLLLAWLFITAFLGCWAIIVPEPGADIATKAMRRVCLTVDTPLVRCSPGSDASTSHGYEVQLFKETAAFLVDRGFHEWSPNNWTFVCMDWDPLLAALKKPNGDPSQCDVAFGGIRLSTDYMDEGLAMAATTTESGFSILIHVPSKIDMFSFLRPFDPNVWILMFATSVVVGVAVLLAEVPVLRIIARPQPAFDKYCNLQWAATALMLKALQQFNVKSTGGRIIVLGFGFLQLILINIYTAVLASQLTITSINLNIQDASSLVNRPVGIWEDTDVQLKGLNLNVVTLLPWNTQEDEAQMLQMLRNGTLDALIFEDTFVRYQASVNCDMYVAGIPYKPYDDAFAFTNGTSLNYISAWEEALIFMEEMGVKNRLRAEYLTPFSNCVKDASALATSVISIPKVAGLWIFLGATTAAGFACNIAAWLWGRYQLAQEEKAALFGTRISNDGSGTGRSSSGSIQGRSKSFAMTNPDLGWLSVAEASTAEEAMEVLEGHVKLMDTRMQRMYCAIEQRLDVIGTVVSGTCTSAYSPIKPRKSQPGKDTTLKSVRVSLPPDTPALYPCGSGAEGGVGTGTPADTTQQQASQAPLAATDVLQPAIQPTPPAWRPEPRQPSPRAPAAAGAVLCAGVGEGVQGAGSRAVPAVDAVKGFHED